MKKILKMLSHNAGLKILALVFAIGLWLYVFNVEDPEITRSFTVEVSFENEDTLTDYEKSYEIVNDSDTIRVTVSAQRSIIEELTSSDFTAVADLDDLTDDQMDGTQELEVYVSLNRYSARVSITSDTRYVTISIEDELSKDIEVAAEYDGTPADGYAVGSIKALPSTVTVKGVESLVEQVASASVVVDVTGLDDDETISADVVFYDESGAVMDMSELTVSYSSVNVYVDCEVVSTVEILVDYNSPYGTPASGYRVTDVSASVSEISIQGEEDAISDLTSIRIDGDALDVTDAQEDVTVTVNASDYLPYGVSMYQYEDVEIEITISITEYENVTVEYSTDDIVIDGLEDGYTASFEGETVSIILSCPVTMNGSVDTSDITLTADLSSRSEGTYYVTLKVEDLPDLVYMNSSAGTTIVISED